jgi:hypothetical protein
MAEREKGSAELEAKKSALIQGKLEAWFKADPGRVWSDDPELAELEVMGITNKEMIAAFKEFKGQNPEVVELWRKDRDKGGMSMSKEVRSFLVGSFLHGEDKEEGRKE